MDLCSGSRRPDEDLQGVGAVWAVETPGHIQYPRLVVCPDLEVFFAPLGRI